ncbi:probable transmembrane ascorbate ferrireductase 4 [Tanacetum coccineum]
MDSSLNNENDSWELSLDIDNSDLHLTPVLCPFSSTRVEPSPSTPNPVRIIPSPTEYMKKVVENVGEDEDFKSGSWVSATDYVNANGGTSCSPNVIGDLTMTMKYFSGTISGIIHHKVIGESGYGNDIIVGAALILANDSVFSPKPSMHYLNIIM